MNVDKFGNIFDDEEYDDDNKIIEPFHNYSTNLDDLENVEGFNRQGKKNKLYGFKLHANGIYKREEIILPNDLKLFDETKVDKNTKLNIVYSNGKWKLIKDKHEWDINIKIKNNTISCKGDSLEILRIYNTGKMIGNLVPTDQYKDTSILTKHHGEYFIGSNKKKNLTILEFVTRFENERELLKKPPDGSTFFISGFLLNNFSKPNSTSVIEGVDLSTEDLKSPTKFWIIIRKNKDDFEVKSFPPKLNVEIGSDVNLDKIRIPYDKYLINRIAFTKSKITNDEIFLS